MIESLDSWKFVVWLQSEHPLPISPAAQTMKATITLLETGGGPLAGITAKLDCIRNLRYGKEPDSRLAFTKFLSRVSETSTHGFPAVAQLV